MIERNVEVKMNPHFYLIADMDKGEPLVMLILTVSAWECSINIVFKKINEVVMTRFKWVITLVINLQLYKELLVCLEIEIAKLDKARTQVAWDYQ